MEKLFVGNGKVYSDKIEIGKNVFIDEHSEICSEKISLEDGVKIGKNCKILSPIGFSLGRNSRIGDNWKVVCFYCSFGRDLWGESHITVGKGGCFSPEATLKIGNRCYLGDNIIFNVSSPISIGDDVGIGEQTNFWTHGASCQFWRDFQQSSVQ